MIFRIDTLPPSQTAEDREIKSSLNYASLALYLQNGAYDLARERVDFLANNARAGEMSDEFLKSLTKELGELNQRIKAIQDQMDDMVIKPPGNPHGQGELRRASGAPRLAINELEDLNETGGNPAVVRPLLVDLYCDYGLPDKAFDLIGTLNIDDPTLSTGIGTATYRQGKVSFLLGNYDFAVNLWQSRSIDQVRKQRSMQATMAGRILLDGDPMTAIRQLLEVPEKVEIQAEWEFELAMAALEGGLASDFTAEHFQTALKLEPNLATRPVIAYYLEKLGKPVPPPRSTAPRDARAVANPGADRRDARARRAGRTAGEPVRTRDSQIAQALTVRRTGGHHERPSMLLDGLAVRLADPRRCRRGRLRRGHLEGDPRRPLVGRRGSGRWPRPMRLR